MKKIVISLLLLLVLGGAAYGGGIGYYAEKFQANTSFGLVDISNLTLAQAKEKINTEMKKESIRLEENGQEIGVITLEDLEGELNLDETLDVIYQSQNPTQWLMAYFSSTNYDNVLMNQVKISNDNLDKALIELGLSNSDRIAAKDASIQYSDARGYYVVEEEEGNKIDFTVLKDKIISSLQGGQAVIDLNTAYLQPEISVDDEKITSVMEKIEKYTQTKITLEIAGQEVTIPQEEIAKWIYFDNANQLVVDRESVMEYLKTLNDQYATFNKPRQFMSTLMGTVTIQPGTLGWSIDRESETEQIIADLEKGQDVTRIPVIVGSGYGNGDDIGSTYVEVDIANQMMFVYIDGVQMIATPVVTGYYGSSETVPGAYSIWNKERNATLVGTNVQRGNDYEQPVDYWMPFDDTGQGIHDAGWQSSFGGTAYLTSGSQGCINTPPDVMAYLFSIVELGTPVIIF